MHLLQSGDTGSDDMSSPIAVIKLRPTGAPPSLLTAEFLLPRLFAVRRGGGDIKRIMLTVLIIMSDVRQSGCPFLSHRLIM